LVYGLAWLLHNDGFCHETLLDCHLDSEKAMFAASGYCGGSSWLKT
jgi:hypothetical protein